jgi:cellulose biosynthesis protein BcsQ/tetratricopeptide (TPR) repeat protein
VIVTFYSFKGGVGRTMAIANIAGLLAKRDKKVLVVDFDLEAPGLWRYFESYRPGLQNQPGLIDLLLAASNPGRPGKVDWRGYVTQVTLAPGAAISLMTSGRWDEPYPAKVLGFDWSAFFEDANGGEFIEGLRNQWLDEYDFTLIDSRTGITDTGGICTIMLPDLIVPVFMSNLQSIAGVEDVIQRAQAQRNILAYDRPPALVLPLMSRFDSRTEYKSAQEWLDIAADALKSFYDDWLPSIFTPRQALERTKLPYVAFFSFGELMPALTHGTSDPESLGYALDTVALLIEERLETADQILGRGSRDNQVPARYQRIPEATIWDFFLSYVQADQAWAEWITWVLEEKGYRVLTHAWDFVSGHDGSQVMRAAVRDAERTVAIWSGEYLTSAYGSQEWQATWADYPRGGMRKMLVARVAASELPGELADAASAVLFGVSESEARDRMLDMAQAALPTRQTLTASIALTGPGAPPRHGTTVGVRFPGSLPRVLWLPPRNLGFVGRGPELAELAYGLVAGPNVTVLSVQGPAGAGKSQLAAEYAHAHARDYDVVWWIDAGDRAGIAIQFTALAVQFGLSPATRLADLQAQIRQRLSGVLRWLLVFDNADAVDDVAPWLPGERSSAADRSHVIVTTRRGGFGALGRVIDLDAVTPDDAVRLLQSRAPGLDRGTATRIGDELGRLPQALTQVASYLDRTQIPPQEYLELLRYRTIELLGQSEDPGGESARADTVATLWDSSFTRVGSINPAAMQLLAICAYLADSTIALSLFTAHPHLLPEPLSSAAADQLDFARTVTVLGDFSLAERTADGLTLHRLIKAAMRGQLDRVPQSAGSDEDRKTGWQAAFPPGRALQVTLDLLLADAPAPVNMPRADQARWAMLLPHVLAVTGWLDQAPEPDPQTMRCASLLFSRAGMYARQDGRLTDAVALLTLALDIDTALFDADDPAVAADLRTLAQIQRDLRQPADARPLAQRALVVDETALGPDDPAVAADLRTLAQILRDLGQPTQALPLAQRALVVDETALGPDDPAVAADLRTLAQILRDLGQPTQALPLAERALTADESAFGAGHPTVAIDLGTIALILRDLRRPRQARPLLLRARANVGPDRPATPRDLTTLADVLNEAGLTEMARPLLERASAMTGEHSMPSQLSRRNPHCWAPPRNGTTHHRPL